MAASAKRTSPGRLAAHAFDADRRVGGGDGAKPDKWDAEDVAFDEHLARRAIAAAARDHEGSCQPRAAPGCQSAPAGQRDLDIGLGDQLADHLDPHVLPGPPGQRQQQGGRGTGWTRRRARARLHRSFKFDGHAGAAAGSQLAQVVDGAAQSAQRIDQVANRALVHARQRPRPRSCRPGRRQHGQCGGERAHGGACVAEEKLGAATLTFAPMPSITTGPLAAIDAAAQTRSASSITAGVVGSQQVVHDGAALRQASQQQHAVGNALGPGSRTVPAALRRAGDRGKVLNITCRPGGLQVGACGAGSVRRLPGSARVGDLRMAASRATGSPLSIRRSRSRRGPRVNLGLAPAGRHGWPAGCRARRRARWRRCA